MRHSDKAFFYTKTNSTPLFSSGRSYKINSIGAVAASGHGGVQNGFTLIETLVALAIVAIALAAGGQATQALTRGSERQGDQVLAQLCAENALHAVRLSRQMPGVGVSTIDCQQAGQAFVTEMNVQPTPNPNFRRVDVRVRRPLESHATNGSAPTPTLMHIATVVGRY